MITEGTTILVLLAIDKNWNRMIFGVVPLIYRNTVSNLIVYGFDINHHIGLLGISRLLKLQKTHATDNDIESRFIMQDL